MIVACVAALAYSLINGGGHVKSAPGEALEGTVRLRNLEKEATKLRRKKKAASREPHQIQAASAGTNGTPKQSAGYSSSTQYAASFSQLETEVSGQIGVAFAPLGSSNVQSLGALQVGHAWSSFKVPIVVTLMLEQHGELTAHQEDLAASAITASDNEAAAALFGELEERTGGSASSAIESVISQVPTGATRVATAPPPPGAVSSWGQTEWSLSAATEFYSGLACGAFGSADKVLYDMEHVISEQQWGLGQAPFPPGTQIAFKAGWGPDSETGAYLVRQSGVVRASDGRGAAVTIAAQSNSGSFEAGVGDVNRIADWVAGNVLLNGSCA